MSDRDDRRGRGDSADEELADLLADLESTLEDLRSELRPDLRGRPRRFPRPPTPGELLRFTEEYTIPTLIAVLEATIRSLELLQRVLRFADPERSLRTGAARTRADEVRREATAGAESALAELRNALAGTELPEDPEARSIIEEARNLAAEIESRLAEGRPRASSIDRDRRDDVTIPVTDEPTGDGDDAEDANAGDVGSDADPALDVEAELRSIREELGSDPGPDGGGPNDGDDGGETDGGGTAGTDPEDGADRRAGDGEDGR